MKEYVRKIISEEYNSVYVSFENENDKVLAIGDKMYELNSEAYMNGYNWDALLNYYLSKHHPDILVGLDSNPEAGSYMAIYEKTPENEARADNFIEVIKSLIENEKELYRIVLEEGDEIEWD